MTRNSITTSWDLTWAKSRDGYRRILGQVVGLPQEGRSGSLISIKLSLEISRVERFSRDL